MDGSHRPDVSGCRNLAMERRPINVSLRQLVSSQVRLPQKRNRFEFWFAKIERKVIAQRVFASAFDVPHKLRRYIDPLSADRPL